MSTVKVSVIIPVYNAGRYLEQCLDSVTGQSLKEIEILCVDDGSTDNSMEILERYARQDGRIQIFTQDHQYAGQARNLGLEHACGQYVIFWDADDYFDRDALRILYTTACREDAQICVCGGYRVDAQSGRKYRVNYYLNESRIPDTSPFSSAQNAKYLFNFCGNVPWNKLILRSFVMEHRLRFQPLKKANDVYFIMLALFYADRISVVKQYLIYYRFFNTNSLSGSGDLETCRCTSDAFGSVKKTLEQSPGCTEEILQSLANKAWGSLCYNLEVQTQYGDYCALFDLYKTHVLKELGLAGRSRSFFYNEIDYEMVRRIFETSPEELLLFLVVEGRRSRDLTKEKIARLQAEIDSLENSTSLKVGRKVTALPRSAKEKLKKLKKL